LTKNDIDLDDEYKYRFKPKLVNIVWEKKKAK